MTTLGLLVRWIHGCRSFCSTEALQSRSEADSCLMSPGPGRAGSTTLVAWRSTSDSSSPPRRRAMPEASSSWKPASLQLIAAQPRLPLAACNHEGSVGIIEWQALPWRNRASASWNFVAPHRPAPLSRSVKRAGPPLDLDETLEMLGDLHLPGQVRLSNQQLSQTRIPTTVPGHHRTSRSWQMARILLLA